MAAKRIYQLAKEFEREEKEIIEFLTSQGIKVGNRLSAVSDEAYNLIKTKLLAPPPEPEPEPEPPKPEPTPEPPAPPVQPAQPAPPETQGEQAPAPGKKKKKKNKAPQSDAAQVGEQAVAQNQPVEISEKLTQNICREAVEAGNSFIENYFSIGKKKMKEATSYLTPDTDTWSFTHGPAFNEPDTSPARYWTAVAKLATRGFKLMNGFGLSHREILANMRETLNPLGANYEPKEIFTDEENLIFKAQQQLLFRAFGHGMGEINEKLYDMKLHAERMKVNFEHADLLDYLTNPTDELRFPERVPFAELVDAVATAVRGVARRCRFYEKNIEQIKLVLENFFAWIDGYAKLKAVGADAAKLEKYLELEEKFIYLCEFMSFDNLLGASKKKKKLTPFEIALNELNAYRDNMDDPDAERNFKYKVRGITNVIYKPKEFVFIYRFADLEAQKDYRPPEEIAAAEAAAKAKAEAEAAAKAEAKVETEAETAAENN